MKRYGDSFLQNVSHLSQELNLPLDEGTVLTATAECPNFQRKLTGVTLKEYPNSQKKLAPAKFSAWQMWQAGLSLQEIAVSQYSVFNNLLVAELFNDLLCDKPFLVDRTLTFFRIRLGSQLL